MHIASPQQRVTNRKFITSSLLIALSILLSLIKPSISRSAVPATEHPSQQASFLSIQSMTTAVCPSTVNFGEAIECSIETGGERDTYTFTAAANDRVMIRMIRTSGTFEPEFKVYDPNGTEVCGNYGAPVTGRTCQLAYNGTYTLLAFESFNRTNAGNYTLYLQRLNNPGSAQPINFGQTLAGMIAAGGEFDTYTLTLRNTSRVLVVN